MVIQIMTKKRIVISMTTMMILISISWTRMIIEVMEIRVQITFQSLNHWQVLLSSNFNHLEQYKKRRQQERNNHVYQKNIWWKDWIEQLINKMSKAQKRIQSLDPGKQKSSRGRKPGNTKFTWHKKLRDILEQDLKDKPRHIYETFINIYDGKYPSDLPLNKHGDPDDTKIKQALQRFKRNIEAKVQKEVLL